MGGAREKAPDMTAFDEELKWRTRHKWDPPDFSWIKRLFAGATELDAEELMGVYDQWAKNADDWGYSDTTPESFLDWLAKPSRGMKRFERKYSPKSGAADQFKTMFGVQEDVGKAQRQFRQPDKFDYRTGERSSLK